MTTSNPSVAILIVEESPDFRLLLRLALTSEAYRIIETSNEREALTYLSTHPDDRPSVIVLDLGMPMMDGVNFRATQAADPQLRNIPVLLYTCEPTPEREVVRLGVAGFVPKSSGPIEIRASMSKLCRRHSMASNAEVVH